MGNKTAKMIEGGISGGWSGDARLYKLSEPVEYADGETEYVIVSAVDLFGFGDLLGFDALSRADCETCETYIFPADAEGENVSWLELEGSIKGVKDHAAALRGAGYEVVE